MDMMADITDPFSLDVPPEIATIRRIIDGFKNFQVLRAACDSGLCDWLQHNGPADKAAIGAGVRLRGAHLGAFLQSLEDLGVVTRADGRYALAPGMSRLLCADARQCQAGLLAALPTPPSRWADLRGFLSETWTSTDSGRSWPLALHPYLGESRGLAACLTARWNDAPPRRLLCFDGADGLAAAAICQHRPRIEVTVVVPPDALGRTRALIDACGLSGQCQPVSGTLLEFEAGCQYDCVVLFHSLYPHRKSTADALARTASHVRSGGEFCSAHWFCLESCETAPGGLRDLDKAVLTDSHPLCHIERFGQRIQEAGLKQVERHDMAGEYGNTKLHFARR